MHEESVAATAVRMHLRVRRALLHPGNWVQLTKYILVGGSGYLLNLGVFAAAVSVFGIHHAIAAGMAFVVAVTNNFFFNRRWTFTAHEGHAGFQAVRFFLVSIAAFLVGLGLLELFVALGLQAILAQAIAVALVAPLTFVGNKMWSFGRSVPRA